MKALKTIIFKLCIVAMVHGAKSNKHIRFYQVNEIARDALRCE